MPYGTTQGNRAFSLEQADDIRREYQRGGVTYLDLAERWGVSEGTISRIIKGRTYRGRGAGGERSRVFPVIDPDNPQQVKELGERLYKMQEEMRTRGELPLPRSLDTPAEPEWKSPPTRMTQKAVDRFREIMGRDPAHYVLIPEEGLDESGNPA